MGLRILGEGEGCVLIDSRCAMSFVNGQYCTMCASGYLRSPMLPIHYSNFINFNNTEIIMLSDQEQQGSANRLNKIPPVRLARINICK